MFLVTFAMIFIEKVPQAFFAYLGLAGGIGAITLVALKPYRLKRFISFLDPWENIRTGGFQIIQSFVAFQNGEIFGLGLGESKQKLYFLPEAHTDFILAVISEELGIAGVTLVLLLYCSLLMTIYSKSVKLKDPFQGRLCLGIFFLLTVEIVMNVSVVMGLVPTKGTALPFLSSGASSLILSMIELGNRI